MVHNMESESEKQAVSKETWKHKILHDYMISFLVINLTEAHFLIPSAK